jgi:hypothetical protein
VAAWEYGLVLGDLEAAKRAFDAALAAVADAQQQVVDARADVPRARQRLHEEIVKAALSGARQVDIAEASGYRRERVRQILRAAGVEPD